MPKGLASVAAKGAITGAAIGLTVASGGLAAPIAIGIGVAAFGATVGMGLLASPEKPAEPRASDKAPTPTPVREAIERRQLLRSSIAPHRIIYGETKVGGVLVAGFSTGTNKEYIHLVIAIAGHEVNAISNVWLDDKLSTDAIFSGLVRVNLHLGSDTQTADTDLVTEVTQWTTNHRLRGITYAYIRLKWDENVWLRGIPDIKFQIQGRKVYDPRTLLTVYSNNAVLCQLDYLRSSFGYETADGKIDMTLASAAANICDENVSLLGGGTQKRYTCDGSFTRDQRPIDIMNDLLTSSVGSCLYIQGKYRMYAGAWSTPNTQGFDEDDLRGAISGQTKHGRGENYNAVRGVFVDTDQDYKLTDFPAITNSTYETQDGGERQYLDIELPFTNNIFRAERIAKIHLQRGRQGIIIRFPAKLTAWEVSPWEVVKISISRFSWTNKTFRILKRELTSDWGIDLLLQEDTAAAWGWSSSEEQSLPSVPAITLPDPYTVATPTGLSLDSTAAQLLQLNDGTVLSRIKVSWTLVPDQLVLNGGNYEVQFKKSADADYSTAFVLPGNVNFGHIVGVQDGVNYDVRVRAINKPGTKSAFATVAGHTVVGKTGSPSIPTGLAAVAYATAVGLSWNVNPDTDIAGYQIQRANNSGFTAGVADISRPLSLTYVDELGDRAVTRYYRIRALNRSGVYSGYTAGVSATTAGIGPNALKVDVAIITVAAQIANALIVNAHIQNLAVDEAKIGNLQVTTIKIANQAVSQGGLFSDDSFTSFAASEVQVGSITISTNGGIVAIWGSASLETLNITDDILAAKLRVRKDSISGTVLATNWVRWLSAVWNVYKDANFICLGQDLSPAASQTYVMSVEGLVGGYTQYCGYRRLFALDMKK